MPEFKGDVVGGGQTPILAVNLDDEVVEDLPNGSIWVETDEEAHQQNNQ